MSELRQRFLSKVRSLNVNKSDGRRRPHKPLLLLIAIGRLLNGSELTSFEAVKETLVPLLNAYAPPVKNKHQPELPYWHLQSDGIWTVSGATELPLQKGGFPKLGPLSETSGRLSPEFAAMLHSDRTLASQVVRELLDDFFPETAHSQILDQVGIDLGSEQIKKRKRRDPAFRNNVLRAYEYRCAVTGFRASLGGSYFGVEAGHVRWHAYDGPDDVTNGIALEPTIHKLFDAGAWTLTDDRRILVSAEYTGSDEAIARLRSRHGSKVADPLPGFDAVQANFIRWHRDPKLGGVFREPALVS